MKFLGLANNKLKHRKYVKFLRDKIKRFITVSLGYPQLLNVEKYSNILILAPHPDDEVIGLGGFMWQCRSNIKNVLVFTNGSNRQRVKEALMVSEYLGVPYKFVGQKDRINESESLNFLKEYLNRKTVDLLVFPSPFEIHIDHFVLFELCRKLIVEGQYEFDVLLYEVWNTLLPNFVVDISNYYEEKKKLINFYESQVKEFNYVELALAINKFRGMIVKRKYGEGVMLFSSKEFKEVFR
jgi:LmbE family N-acetylglucosaminyl deacetylase